MSENRKKTFLAGAFGNALEWYDFTAYAFFAPLLASLFFPSADTFASLLLVFGVFTLSFLIRPFGAIFFGYIGDHFGRRIAMIMTIVMMSFSTLLLGFLPSYMTIGVAAPILLTVLRLLQGLAVSGELTSTTSFLIEHAHEKKRGFAGSLAMWSAFVGITLSSVIVTLITLVVSEQHLLQWGWRLPFIFGGLSGLVGLILRIRSSETAHYQKSKENNLEKPRPTVLQHYRHLQYKSILVAILLTCVMAIGNWFLIGYFNSFLIKFHGFSSHPIMLINCVCLVIMTVLMPFMGMLSDKVGRKPVLTFGMVGLIVMVLPIFWLLQQPHLYSIFLGELLFAALLAPIAALIPTTLAELFHVHTRNSSISLGYNISLGLFGGTAPLIAIRLLEVTKNPYAPAWYLMIGAVLSFTILILMKETFHEELR